MPVMALLARALWHSVGKIAERAQARAKYLLAGLAPRWFPRAAQSLGTGQCPSGLDPRDVGLVLCLHTSVSLISLAPEIQDGGETLVTEWWEAEF